MAEKTKTTKEKTTKTTTKAVKAVKAPKVADSKEFAVIKTGGKQYQVSVGETLDIEILKDGEFKPGDKIVFDKVLLVDDGSNTTIGTPYIDGAKVTAELVESNRAKKITVIKYKPKSRYFKKRGHRQPYFKVLIISIK